MELPDFISAAPESSTRLLGLRIQVQDFEGNVLTHVQSAHLQEGWLDIFHTFQGRGGKHPSSGPSTGQFPSHRPSEW